MTIHEFGKNNKQIIVLLHPSAVMWDYFEYVIPLMEDKCHLIVPALPGYDEDQLGDFTSVEEIAGELANWLVDHGHKEIDCIYGCSMGGAVVARFLSDDRVKAKSAVMDGGITPYQLPWIATRFIAIRDFLLIYAGKLGGAKLLEKAFSADEYSDEDLKYIEKVLNFMSPKTIWRTFESCNNYSMPDEIKTSCGNIEYWHAAMEGKDRKWDIEYISENFPQAEFRVFEDNGHGGLAALKPDVLAAELERVIRGDKTELEGQVQGYRAGDTSSSDKEKSRTYFNKHNKTIVNRHGYWWVDYNATSEILISHGAHRVIDIGCGNGAFLEFLSKKAARIFDKHLDGRELALEGLDYSAEMVKTSAERLPDAKIHEGDAENMPLEDSAYDGVTCHMSIHHYPHPEKALGEMHRILKPGGIVVINDLTGPKIFVKLMNQSFKTWNTGDHAIYTVGEMEQMLRNAGFEDIEYRLTTPFTYIFTAKKRLK